MSTEIITSIINAFAPTIASKLIPILTNRKMSQEEYNVAILSLLAEQNNRSTTILEVLNKHCDTERIIVDKILCNIEGNCIKLEEANENITVLLHRTDVKKKKV